MLEKIKNKFPIKFWIAVLFVSFIAWTANYWFFSPKPLALTQVLSSPELVNPLRKIFFDFYSKIVLSMLFISSFYLAITQTTEIVNRRRNKVVFELDFEKKMPLTEVLTETKTEPKVEMKVLSSISTPALPKVLHGPSMLTDFDIYLFKKGEHYKIYEKLGAHPMTVEGVTGVYFAVWAPNANYVSVIGDFNGWNNGKHPLTNRWDSSGIWEGFIPHLKKGNIYKYYISSHNNGYRAEKGDPYGILWEVPPKTASVIWELDYQWQDQEWMQNRKKNNSLDAPWSIYEVHLGSWRRVPEDNNRSLNYRELAHQLVDYVKEMGFTHVEFLPVMEHPFFASWGYQTVGYFAPSSRYGTPEDFMYLVDHLHQNGIGVILDWVPSHFPSDLHGLSYFDGTHLYEHEDLRKGFHPDWKSFIFNYGRAEVQNFLLSSAIFWLEKYHIDGIRVDAVASMLYLDYSREDGEWIPNHYGGRENLEAINFLKKFNAAVYKNFPDVQTIAEESTAWPMVSRPTDMGGLGFGMKWNMGWMHDTLEYFKVDPLFRKYHQNELTFSMLYCFTENFVIPLSHDEVVHGKGSLFGKMPGDNWQQFANLRLLYSYMFSHPGKKLMFMGGEFGQWAEWNHDVSVDWHILEYSVHQGVKNLFKDLNHIYRNEKALHEIDFDGSGFYWIDASDHEHSILSFIRRGKTTDDTILVVCNFTPTPHSNYQIGVPKSGYWKEMLNSDSTQYGGSGMGNLGGVNSESIPMHGHGQSVSLTLPPLSTLIFKHC